MSKLSRTFLLALLLLAWPVAATFAQSQSPYQQSHQQPQSPSPPQSQSPTPDQKKDESLADAAKKAQAAKPKPKKVYTEEDLSGMHKGGVSVVGNENKRTARRTQTANPGGDYDPNGEEYWRSRSQPLLDEIAATDQRIEQLREDIKKYGNGGFDVQTGMKDNIAYVHDRNGQIEALQKRKTALQKQLEDLEEEGRKAGAQPAWFR
jgi:DNA repair exonuclease SbcCD ATPase subunit